MIRFFYILITVVSMIPSYLLASSELIETDNKKHIVVLFNQLKRSDYIIHEVNSKSLPAFLFHDRLNLCKDLETEAETETDTALSLIRIPKELFILKIDNTSNKKNPKVQIFWKNQETLHFFITFLNRSIIDSPFQSFLKNFWAQFEKSGKDIRLLNIQSSIIEEVEPIDKLHLEEIKGVTSSIEKVKSHYSGIEIDKNKAVVSLRKTEWEEIPLAVLIFERINPEDNTLQIDYRTFLPNSTQNKETVYQYGFRSFKGFFRYQKSEGKISSLDEKNKQELLKLAAQKDRSWKLENFYIEKALSYIDRNFENRTLSFIFEPNNKSKGTKINPKTSHYTSASFAEKVLREYCYLVGLDEEPFKSELTVSSLMKVALNASPSSSEKSAEKDVGLLISVVNNFFTEIGF